MKQFYFECPLSQKCVALTTTTILGNMAYQVDEGKDVLKHRKLLADTLGVSLDRFTFVHQHHSDLIEKVDTNDIGRGLYSFEDGLECDALYTYEKNVPLCIFHADCVPIFFIDEDTSLVGIIHSGYKGTLKHIAYKAIKQVSEKENIPFNRFKFYIGPYRMVSSFSIDENNKTEIKEAGLETAIKGNFFDNGAAVISDLLKLGIKEDQISSINIDTVTEPLCYSAKLKTPVGRMVSLIYLK